MVSKRVTDDVPIGYCYRYPPVLSEGDEAKWILPRVLGYHWCGEWQAKRAHVPTDVDLDQPVEVLELSVRAMNCFGHENIITVRDLVSHTENELLRIRNFGKTVLHYTKEALKARGLWLGMLPPKEKP
jgi:DNA-directed RNA polymerase alpha subunit